MANQWFKFYGGEYLADPKMAALTPQERSCWITILCLASMATCQGDIGFLTVEVLLSKSGIVFDPYNPDEWNNNLGVLKKFENMKMLKLREDGSVFVKNWEKRQEHNLTVAERVAKSRLKKKNVTINVTNVTTEENRIEENREEKREDTPAQIAKSFFEGGKHYDEIREEMSVKVKQPILDNELNKFNLYWTEPNKSGTKVRWEQQNTFDVRRRLVTWFSKIKDYQPQSRGRGLA